MKTILDTNILIYAAKYKIDIKELDDVYTLDKVISELEKLSEGKSKLALSARIALKIAKGLKILHTKENVDKALVTYAKKGYAIATQDRAVRDKIKALNRKSIYLRQKKYFSD